MTNVSAVIPTYNGQQLLAKHLPNVLKALRPGDEVIIVDDASSDGTVAWLTHEYELHEDECVIADVDCYTKKHKEVEVKVLVNQHNQRFASSCNRGVSSAKAEIIVLLNNDVTPEKNFLEPLLTHFRDPLVFAVGCKELAAGEGDRAYGRSGGSFKRGFLVHYRQKDQDQSDTLWVAGGSAAFRRSMWETLKGFDVAYRPAYWEDIDLSWRARAHGWKVLFEPKSVVHHVHESTNASVFGKHQMEIMAYKNSILFMWKNAKGMQLISHWLWMPYHLVFTTVRSHGRFFQGFLLAIRDSVASPPRSS